MLSDSPEFQLPTVFLADVQLAQSATVHYQQTSEPYYLDAAVEAWNRILQHPSFATTDLAFRLVALNDGGGAYLRRYWVTGNMEDLHQAVQYLQQGLEQTPLHWSDRPSRSSNLGAVLSIRYRQIGNLADLKESIQLCEAAVQQTPPDSLNLPARLTNLGNALSARYQLTSNRGDLDRSLSVYEEAVNKTPFDDPDLPLRLNNWGTVLEDYYRCNGQLVNLKRALRAYAKAVQKTPAHSPDLPIYLNNLGNGLTTYYLQRKRLNILNYAIACCKQAVTATVPDSPDQPGYLMNLGNALRNRYTHTGNWEDLNQAIQAYQSSVEKTPADSTYRPMFLHNMAVGLRDRYFRTGEQDDLDQAIREVEAAVHQSPSGSPELPGYLSTLGTVLDDRYSRTGSLEDLKRATTTHQRAVELTPLDSPHLPIHLNNWGNALRNHYTRTRNLPDLKQAIAAYDQAVKLTESNSAYLASRLNNLANSLRDRYIHTQDLPDLKTAIKTYRQAIAKTPSNSPENAPIQNNLGNALRDQFHHTGQLAKLNQAIVAYEQGVQQTSLQSPELPGRQNNLASALKDRFTQTGEDSDRVQARDLFEQAAIQGLLVAPEATLLASRNWGTWATERQTWSEAVTAYRYSLQAIEQLFRTQLLRTSKETWLREVQGISAQAAFALAKEGDFTGAVEALEQGLARLLSETLDRNRADLEQLKELGQGELCNRYQAVTEQWHGLIRGQEKSTQPTDPNRADSLQAVQVELEETLAAIRQVSGYEDFLKPPTFKTIQSVAHEVTLVYIVVTDMGGLALILNPNQDLVTPLWLPDLTEVALRSQLVGADVESAACSYLGAYSHWLPNQQDEQSREVWLNALDNTTRWLWQVLMGSLLEVLGTVETAVLIPVGVLGLLPLHAAWTEDAMRPTGRCYAIDRLTITYAPNARALNAARTTVSKVVSESVLAITDPQPVSAAPLNYAEYEATVATSIFSQHHALSNAEATLSAVLTALPNSSIVHFACHAYANLMEPLTSGLVMSNDEVLSLRNLLYLRLTGARLAILSACETGIPGANLPDEVISLSTGLLQAGFAGVVASLWSVLDLSTTMLLVRFYHFWQEQNYQPAEALCQAQLWLRDTTSKQKATYFKETNPYIFQSLILLDPDYFAHPFYWAAFSYTGV